MTDDQLLKDAKAAFQLASDAESQNREDALDDLKFARLGEQWPEAARKQREADGRPMQTINRMPAFIRQVVNDARQNRPGIKCSPVDDRSDVQTAKMINGLIRNIENISNADVAYDTAIDFAVSCGFGYWRLVLDYAYDDSFDMDILIRRISNPFSVYGCPHSQAADSSDWMSAFVVDRMSKSMFEHKHKGAEPVDWETDYASLGVDWVTDEEVQVAEYWVRDEAVSKIVQLSNPERTIISAKEYQDNLEYFQSVGVKVTGERDVRSHKVTQYILTGAELLETNTWDGKYIPIIPVYGDEVNVEGTRYFRSLFRDGKDAQRNYNFWRTTTTELVSDSAKNPWIGPVGAFSTDRAKWDSANRKAWPYIEYDVEGIDGASVPFRAGFSGPPPGAIQEALSASDDMKAIIGLHDASLGARSNETSGIAIMRRQKEGDVSTFHFLDNLARAQRHNYVVMLDLIPKVYGVERMVRILGDDGKSEMVKIGKQQKDESGQITVFDLSLGKYDMALSTGQNYTTRREEIVAMLMEIVRIFPPAAPYIGPMLAKNLDFPGSEELHAALKSAQEGSPQMQQLKQVLAQLKAELQKAQAEAQLIKTNKSIEARKVDIDAYNAETNRIKAVEAGMSPEIVQSLVVKVLDEILNSPDTLPPDQETQMLNVMPPDIGMVQDQQSQMQGAIPQDGGQYTEPEEQVIMPGMPDNGMF